MSHQALLTHTASLCGSDSWGLQGMGTCAVFLSLAHVTEHVPSSPLHVRTGLCHFEERNLLRGHRVAAWLLWASIYHRSLSLTVSLGFTLFSSPNVARLTHPYAESSYSHSSPLQDNGNYFTYTGSGGRDLSGNKRTAGQSSDQKLTNNNRSVESMVPVPWV